MGIMDVVKFASSNEVQAMMGKFNEEVDAIHHDRVGLKAALPIIVKRFEDRLDALEKKIEDGFAAIRAQQDAMMLLLTEQRPSDVPNPNTPLSPNGCGIDLERRQS